MFNFLQLKIMKIQLKCIAFALIFAPLARGQTPMSSTVVAPGNPVYVVQNIDENTRIWAWNESETGPNGKTIFHPRHYIEFASGLNFQNSAGNWQPTVEQIQILADGSAAAMQGPDKVTFPANILAGEIQLTTAEGLVLQSQPMGLMYYDGTNTAFIALLTNSVGQLEAPNQLVYPNAFNGLRADLRFSYKRSGLEQDVILHQRPPDPEVLGLNRNKTRMQIWTEFLGSAQPVLEGRELPNQAGLHLVDEAIHFGSLQLIPGKAFSLPKDSLKTVVAKSWVTIQNRHFLVEEVPYQVMVPQIQELSASSGGWGGKIWASKARIKLPSRRNFGNKKAGERIRLARQESGQKPAFVIDYQTLNGALTNLTFQGDSTYYISGYLKLYGTNVFESGAVLKYATNAALDLSSAQPIVMKTSEYRPVIFTAKDDNSVGFAVSGSTGTPTNVYANPAIVFNPPGAATLQLSNIRIAHAQTAIYASSVGLSLLLNDGQILDCNNGIETPGEGGATLENVLFANVQTPFLVYFMNVLAQNVTFSGQLASPANNYTPSFLVAPEQYPSGYEPVWPITLDLTNCILANFTSFSSVGSLIPVTGGNNAFYNNGNNPGFGSSPFVCSSDPFEQIGDAGFYLSADSGCKAAGNGAIDPSLLADLASKTTWPPLVYSNVLITNSMVLSPLVQRDNSGVPDLGYHYDPLDYVFGGCDAYASITMTPGTVVGIFQKIGTAPSDGQPYGISLNDSSSLTSEGTATQPCWFVDYSQVQEQPGPWVDSGYMGDVMLNAQGSGTIPSINACFTKWSQTFTLFYRDNWSGGQVSFDSCEFYEGSMGTYGITQINITNCFFYRTQLYFDNTDVNPNMAIENCTMVDGFMVIGRNTWNPPSSLLVENNAFDGTGFAWSDQFNSETNYTVENYNSYNPNNASWQTFSYPYSQVYGTMQTVGLNDVMVTNYDWEASWFGENYLPSSSPLITAGSTTANLIGLFHFTTQTNQTVEGDSVVDIGYHYVATDQYGNPLDTNGDGIPDYLEDINGNGLVDSGEISWLASYDIGLQVQITEPGGGKQAP